MLYVCTCHTLWHVQTPQIAAVKSAQVCCQGERQACTYMQISAELTTESIQYNQCLAGTGGSTGAAAGCNLDERYAYCTGHVQVYLDVGM